MIVDVDGALAREHKIVLVTGRAVEYRTVNEAYVERPSTMSIGKTLLVLGVGLAVAGLLLQLAPALRLGRLPGDLSFGGSNWRVYIPIGTSILLSIALTLALSIAGTLVRR